MIADPERGRMLMLRDTQGVAPSHAALPAGLVPIVARFTGEHTCAEIARAVSRETGETVPTELVVEVAEELEAALFVDGPRYRAARERIEREFADAPLRPASHAGGAYHADPVKLATYIDTQCLDRAGTRARPRGGLKGLVAPHIDPWRGATCYGHAYDALRGALTEDVDTFILLGTSHAPMRSPFALCRKAFDTPLGPIEADVESIDALAAACDFEPYADQFNHKREHSLEFQAVFLRHLLGPRPARIVPVLAGLGAHQVRGTDPAGDASVERFLDALRGVVATRRAIVIAGADLAHVGPRFGDAKPLDDRERRELDDRDRQSLEHAVRGDARRFWSDVAQDLETRRVCGLAPVYSLLRVLGDDVRGEVCHYEQTVDPEEGSIVSHAAVAFHG
jgi:MEMO1 family protein